MSSILFRVGGVLFVVLLVLAAVTYFGSYELRKRYHHLAIQAINPLRTAQWMPTPIGSLLNNLYDLIPESEGLVVDGGELGRDQQALLAGVPLTGKPVRILKNKTSVLLFDEQSKQALCVAYRLDATIGRETTLKTQALLVDPRVTELTADKMQQNGMNAQPIITPETVKKSYGDTGIQEASLLTSCVPLTDAFYTELWSPLIEKIGADYTQRFDEIWIYSGPIYDSTASKLRSGIPIPDALYVIVFDITDLGGLRALALLLPTDTRPETPLSEYITTIHTIQQATGLNFLPEIDYDTSDVLVNWQSPDLW